MTKRYSSLSLFLTIATVPLALLATACRQTEKTQDSVTKLPKADSTLSPSPFAKQVLDAARGYQNLALLTSMWHLAPGMCRAASDTEFMQMSQTGETTPHGRKLYHLWVKDVDLYSTHPEQGSLIGQTLVKESFEAIEPEATDDFTQYAHTPEGNFKPGARRELFVMLKLDSSTPGTDEGWVYGTVAPDLSRTLQSGRIQSCMECHTKRPSRMFGLKVQ